MQALSLVEASAPVLVTVESRIRALETALQEALRVEAPIGPILVSILSEQLIDLRNAE
ncbi:hypothetical protein [Paenirhodobacter populi]|uniref:hypothetical protein n=1 Tax=Paenirhodobacter populi TaxID=2306993 RepID=UPI0013E2E4E7|nr:hypothetical protein [Sinirhodobacter populi]